MTEVRTRFAPSPTGFLHIGGMRSAFFAYFLARHYGGKFILRIEDTDQARTVPGAIRYIVEGFQWFGIEYDEGPTIEELKKIDDDVDGLPDIGGDYGPYIQSQRLERYREVAAELIESGHAYRCDCTPEMLEKERNEQMARKEVPGYSGYCRTREVPADVPHVLRFKMPHKPKVTIQDAVRGRLSWDDPPLRDPILMKSDGFPTYHLAVVVDDHDMKITHAMRGEEWIPSTPLHVLVYEALGWDQPVFAHLPVILGTDGKKLSKRHGSTSWSAFRDEGYLPEAVLNYVMLVGWSPGEGDEQEIFTREELAQKFTLDRINSSSGVFDYKKLEWMNGQYLKAMPVEEFSNAVIPKIEAKGISVDRAKWDILAAALQERARHYDEVPAMVEFLFTDTLQRDIADMFGKKMDKQAALATLREAKDAIASLNEFTLESIESVLKPIHEKLELKLGPTLVAIRIATLGKKATPPLFDSILALGKEESLKRLDEAIEEVEAFKAEAA